MTSKAAMELTKQVPWNDHQGRLPKRPAGNRPKKKRLWSQDRTGVPNPCEGWSWIAGVLSSNLGGTRVQGQP